MRERLATFAGSTRSDTSLLVATSGLADAIGGYLALEDASIVAVPAAAAS
jgi:hypothetical protein